MRAAFLAWTSIVVLLGCHASVKTPTPPPPERDTRVAPIRTEADDLEDLAHDVQYAADRVEEGAAVKRLQRWQTDHGTTFKIEAEHPDSHVAIVSPSTHAGPVLANVTIFRGQQPIHRFTWIPKDNGNLALLGQ